MAFNFSEWQATWIQAVGKAWTDPQFRQALLADPRAAIKTYLQVDLPGDFPIRVVESDDGRLLRELVLTIPPEPSKERQEADALGQYARGVMTDTAFICMC